jgi:hypothetical protein
MAKEGYTLDRARDERELMDEIWREALGELYRGKAPMQGTPSARQDVIDSYLDKTPEMRRYVENHIENGTCGKAVREIRADREKRKPKPPRVHQPRKGRTFIVEMTASLSPVALPDAAGSPASEKRRRGPEPRERARVKELMRTALDGGFNIFEKGVKDAVLEAKFGAKRTTCRAARIELLEEINSDKKSPTEQFLTPTNSGSK